MALSMDTAAKGVMVALLSVVVAVELTTGAMFEIWHLVLSAVLVNFCTAFVLSYLAVVFGGFSQQAGIQAETLSDILKTLNSNAGHLSNSAWNLEQLTKLGNFANTKLTYIERRIDRAQATIRDVLRHVQQKILEFDNDIGEMRVLQKWIAAERDQWLQRLPGQNQ